LQRPHCINLGGRTLRACLSVAPQPCGWQLGRGNDAVRSSRALRWPTGA